MILGINISESPVFGEQEETDYNRHFGSVCYSPLFVFNQLGDCEGAKLRPDNVHTPTTGWRCWPPSWPATNGQACAIAIWADAAFGKPELYEYLEDPRTLNAIRLPSNEVLE